MSRIIPSALSKHFARAASRALAARKRKPRLVLQSLEDRLTPVTVALGASSYSFSEGVGTAAIDVVIISGSGSFQVNYSTSNGTATAGFDYTASSGTISPLSPGGLTIYVPISDDATAESTENFTVTLSAGVNSTIGSPGSATVDITDNDTPVVSIASSTYSVGESGGTVAVVVQIDRNPTSTVTVNYATSNGTAAAGSDYTSTSSSLTFSPGGSLSQTVYVPVTDDSLYESSETFTFALSSPTNSILGSPSTSTVTITDNDTPPTVSLSSSTYSVNENAGTVTVTAQLSTASGTTTTVNYATSNGTAKSGSDYTSASGTLTFNAGETSKTFNVSITDDTVREQSETFTATLSSPTGATLGSPSSATVTITDDDSDQLPEVYLGASTLSVGEGSSPAQMAVVLSDVLTAGEVVTVDYSTLGGTATDTADFTGVFGTVQFVYGGSTSQNIDIPILEDRLIEGNEDFTLTLANPSGASLGSPETAVVTITDNDSTVSGRSVIQFPKFYWDVDESGPTIVITIERTESTASDLTVDYSTSDGTAIAGSDYTTTSGTATILAGQTTTTFSVPITSDGTIEGPEDFFVILSNPTIVTGTVVLGGVIEAPITIVDPITTPIEAPVPESCDCPQLTEASENPAFSKGDDSSNTSGYPIRYGDGTIDFKKVDLVSQILDSTWGHARSWSANVAYTSRGVQGYGWVNSQMPVLVKSGANTFSLIESGISSHVFDLSGGVYTARNYDPTKMTFDAGTNEYVFTDASGNQSRFLDFGSGRAVMERGSFASLKSASGTEVSVTSRHADGRILAVQQSGTVNGQTVTESFVYSYVVQGKSAGLLRSVKLLRQLGAGSSQVVGQVQYEYWASGSSHGRTRDLKTATVLDKDGKVLGTDYYRYWTANTSTSIIGGLKQVFSAESYARLVRAVGNPDSASDSTVQPYLDNYFEYDSSRRVTKEIAQGAGCSACTGGQGTFTYTYTASANTPGFNSWAMKTVETLPDSSTRTVYTNAYAQVMLIAHRDSGGSSDWIEYHRYDSAGRRILSASPAAVSGYDDTKADLVDVVSSNAVHLRDSVGLIATFTYGTSTTATTSTAGDVLGYWKSQSIQKGETGTAVPQAEWTYIGHTANSITVYNIASQSQFRNTNGTGTQSVTHAYTYHSGTNRVQQETITYPTVTTAQNGSNSPTADVVVADLFGRPVWVKDADGFIHYNEYDPLTGAVVKRITDVNTATTSDFTGLPSGWSTPGGGGLHLKATSEVDILGRPTKITYPNGRIDYVVYRDWLHEVRFYSAWNATTNLPTGPTTVVRNDMAAGYTEVLTMSATPALSSGRPTGAEAIDGIQTLSREYVNAAGQVVSSDIYFSLSSLRYSAKPDLGTENTHYYRTRFVYDNHGLLNKTITPAGTIHRVVHDFRGQPVSEWVGTDDTPTTGFWSPSNTGGTDLVQVAGYEYDLGGVGNGNLTKSTTMPGSPYSNRDTIYSYDWRDRPIAVKGAWEASESTSFNRPLLYKEYDNLGQPIVQEMYDGDTLSITTDANTDGVPDRPSSSALRAKSTTDFNELGQVYKSSTFSVDPTSGSVSSNALVSQAWFNSRGSLIKTSAPGGSVSKISVDGASRVVASYLTDGGGDSGYGDADDVTGDAVLSQTEWTYDANSNPIFVASKERFHDETGTGVLGTPSTGNKARVSYVASYFDLADRLTDMVDVGTNGGSAYTRAGSVPSRSDTVLINSVGYNAAGWQETLTDPKGLIGKLYYDLAGQTTKVIENYVNGTVSDTDDKTVEFENGPAGRTKTKAKLTGGGEQVTENIYGITGGLVSNDMLKEVRYPDASTGASSSSEKDVYTYNQIGELLSASDRNGNVHSYSIDLLGRMTIDNVTTLGSGVDGAIRRIDVGYNTQGLPYLFTSYDSGSTVINQVQREFDGLGQLTKEWQAHNGAVSTSTSPKVEYAYSFAPSGSTNHSRLTDLTYPNGRNLDYNYASGLNADISRLSSISDGGTTLESYEYLGYNQIVTRAHPQTGVDLTYVKLSGESDGAAGDKYNGLDRFGRIVDQRWTTSGGTTKDRFQYGYDRNSNPLYKENLNDSTQSELFAYDGLDQLTNFSRGTLNGGKTAISGSPSRTQGWDFDALGNFDDQATNGTSQTRSHNKQNEITAINGATTPVYDANGNQTTDQSGRTNKFDAWNVLVEVKNSGGTTLAAYERDALGRRIQQTTSGTTTDFHHDGWQTVEERVGGTPTTSYAWSPVYIDAMIARDRDTDANGSLDERLYPTHDANFNMTALVNTSGTVVERFLQDAYGAPTYFDTSYGTRGSSSYGWNYLHQGLRWDGTTGKYWNRMRDFDPEQGRFIETDPQGFRAGDLVWYRYEGNSPYSQLDALGLEGVGHHFLPVGVQLDDDILPHLSKRALKEAAGAVSGPTWPSHSYDTYGGVKHSDYNKLVKEEMLEFMKNKGIVKEGAGGKLVGVRKMAKDEMIEFIKNIETGKNLSKASNAKDILSFNTAVMKQAADFERKFGKGKYHGLTAAGRTDLGDAYLKKSARYAMLTALPVIVSLIDTTKALAMMTEPGSPYVKALEAWHRNDLPGVEQCLKGDGIDPLDKSHVFGYFIDGAGVTNQTVILGLWARYLEALENAAKKAVHRGNCIDALPDN